jgi:hypothetical protein
MQTVSLLMPGRYCGIFLGNPPDSNLRIAILWEHHSIMSAAAPGKTYIPFLSGS